MASKKLGICTPQVGPLPDFADDCRSRTAIEFLHNNPREATKTLFATHYHELNDAAKYLPHVRNFLLAVHEK